MDNTYQDIQKEFNNIFSLPPNDLGNKWLTFLYKSVTRPLKKMPFIYILPLSIFIAIAMYFVFGQYVIKLVSVLQYGF